MSEVRITGGCQCGAVRYALRSEPQFPHLCHCRMCQKAFGSYFAALAGVPKEDFEVTRGTVATFNSSDEAERGFCANCGTPLMFRYLSSRFAAVSLGSLDDPAAIKPTVQYGIEARMPWFHDLATLPGEATEDDRDETERFARIKASNHQHPDHDTEAWPQERRT